MPLGIVSDDDFLKELKDSLVPSPIPSSNEDDTPINIAEVLPEARPNHGRTNGDVNVPPSLRTLIGDTNLMEGRQAALDLAKDFGISPSSVSAYSRGATSTASYNNPDKEMMDHLKGRKHKVVKGALGKVMKAMHHLTEDKISMSSAKEISSIAKDMASVVKMMDNTLPENNINTVQQPQFLVYAPQIRDERHFGDVIQSKE